MVVYLLQGMIEAEEGIEMLTVDIELLGVDIEMLGVDTEMLGVDIEMLGVDIEMLVLYDLLPLLGDKQQMVEVLACYLEVVLGMVAR